MVFAFQRVLRPVLRANRTFTLATYKMSPPAAQSLHARQLNLSRKAAKAAKASKPPGSRSISAATATKPAPVVAADFTPSSFITQFSELSRDGLVGQNLVDTLTKSMKLETMTEVQSKTLNEILTGADV